MSNKRLVPAEETGGELLAQRAGDRSHYLCRALCALTVLGLLAYTSYLLFRQLGGSATHQKLSLMVESGHVESTEPASDGLPQLMNVVGRDPGKVAVHLTAFPNSNQKKRVIWKKQGALLGGVDIKGNSLIIRTPGRYFVYSQVTFYSRDCPDRPIFLSHTLQKLSTTYRNRLTLLSSLTSTCQHRQEGEAWFEASYHGAAFELAEGDQIFSIVSAKAMAYVNSEATKTYFGLFAL